MNSNCSSQMVQEPTRINNLLDLFLTNCPELIQNIEVSNTVISDHKLIKIETYFERKPISNKDREERRGFFQLNFHHKRIEWPKINQDLMRINWEDELKSRAGEEILNIIYAKLYSICVRHIPRKGELIRKSIVPRDRRILMRNRTNLNKRMHRVNKKRKQHLEHKLEQVEYKLSISHKNEERAKELRAVGAIRENPRYFFAYARTKSKIDIPIGPLEQNGKMCEDAYGMNNVLQEQFISVFSHPKFVHTNIYSLSQNGIMTDINADITDMQEAINKLPTKSSPGPDGIPTILLKNCVHGITEPLLILFRKTFRSGSIPAKLKRGQITPIHKGGSRNKAQN